MNSYGDTTYLRLDGIPVSVIAGDNNNCCCLFERSPRCPQHPQESHGDAMEPGGDVA